MPQPTTTDTSERGYQRLFVKELLEKQGYDAETRTADFDTEFCINRQYVLDFIRATQPKTYEYLEKSGIRAFLVRLDNQIIKKGIVEVFRKGISHRDQKVRLFYPRPHSIYNQEDAALYRANTFTVTQELVYSHDDRNKNRLDLTIFVNGFPITTMELKNAYTYQAVHKAIIQYKEDRDPRDKIFNLGRCMVHFALDTSQVFMTGALAKGDTRFFPFNKGLNDGAPYEPFGAGNPVNPNKQKTAYMYEEVLSKDSIANLIEKFATIVEERNEETGKKYKVQYFPRYHQLTVVRRLLQHAKAHGAGQRYLIQHSAGSGKSNSITWLAHQLISLYDDKGEIPLFDSVVVVTDRQNLDEQIRNNIKNFAQVRHVVEAITGKPKDIRQLDPSEESASKTAHMRLALANNKKIITCTVQTFPNVLKAISGWEAKRVAIIIDEAHSSQSGNAAASMNAVFSDMHFDELERDEEGNVSTEDLISYLVSSKKMLDNASYFAFTATPKNKTLETFGTPEEYFDEHNERKKRFLPFHTYSMKQAIEEEFIHDVLKNYTTYQSWYKIKQAAEADTGKEYETTEANKKIRKFVEGHEIAIRDKAKIMINHFNQHVKHRIRNQAKAMVVCRSIESAIKYKDAFDAYLAEINSPFKAIVAFSGKKRHYRTGQEVTEAKMNNFRDAENDIPAQFKKDKYRFLIVADKYQTGFDQPLLHTMYVDKQLSGVQAVQTLSRLNRAKKPDKIDTFVLDFYNTVEEIKDAFKPFYTTTVLSEETDINKLHDLQEALDDYQIYDKDEDLYEFFRKFYSNAERSELDYLTDKVSANFQEALTKDEQIDFKSKAKSFYRTYNYLVKIIKNPDQYWEILALFMKHLIPHLKIEEEAREENIVEVIDMDNYRTVLQQEKTDILLEPEVGIVSPIPVEAGGMEVQKQFDTLENIVDSFNRRFPDFDLGPEGDNAEGENILARQIPERLKDNEEALQWILNSDKANAKVTSDELLEKVMNTLMFTQTGIFKKYSKDKVFKKRYQEFIFDLLWSQRGAEGDRGER
ncbi:MAG: type I restriction endonuclease subunit R [Lewinellaceae bacterium]|nr:type I restriction endonuclease subunit R [Lewinellaceae bacterium]